MLFWNAFCWIIKNILHMMCVVRYSLNFQTFSHSIITWTSYPLLTCDLTYISYYFTFLHCNVAPSSFTFDTLFCTWSWTWKLCESNNFHSSYLFWNYFHSYIQPVKNFIPTICLLPIIIQKFIHVPRSSKYFTFFVTFIHVHVLPFIRHKCFGINFIHTFKLVESFT